MLFENLNLTDETSTEFFNDFSNLLTFEELPIKHQLHAEGSVCDRFYIIHTGLVRAYYHQDTNDITAHFAFENSTITAIDSFIQRKKKQV